MAACAEQYLEIHCKHRFDLPSELANKPFPVKFRYLTENIALSGLLSCVFPLMDMKAS